MVNKRLLRICLCLALIIALMMGMVAVSSADDTPKLVFSGVTMRMLEDGSVQGTLDVQIRNVESNGVGFTLLYNSDVVELSDATTNVAETDKNITMLSPEVLDMMGGITLSGYKACNYIKWNTTDFAKDTLAATGTITRNVDVDGHAVGMSKAEFNISVRDNAIVGGNIVEKEYVDTRDEYNKGYKKMVAGKNKSLTLGSISFRVKDPQTFAKLTGDQLAKVFTLDSTSTGASVFMILYVDNSGIPALVKYDTDSHLAYEFNVKNSLSMVLVNNDKATTNAAAIFSAGGKGDLLSWMNLYMSDVTLVYADNTRIPDTLVWGTGVEGVDYEITAASGSYDPKGDTYTVTQKYNSEVTVKATVTVNPVKALSFTCDSTNAYRRYVKPGGTDTSLEVPSGSDPIEVLGLPTRASVVFDTVVAGVTDALKLAVSDSWSSVGPAGTAVGLLDIRDGGADGHGDEGKYTYTAAIEGSINADGTVSGTIFPAWVTDTIGADKHIDVVRVLGDVTPAPEFTAHVTDDGTLVIEVTAVGTDTDITTGEYDYFLRLPNGLVLKESDFDDPANNYKVECAGGKATFSIKAETVTSGTAANAAVQQALRQAINLGSKLGSFALAVQQLSPELPQSDWCSFVTDPRRNVYLAPETGGDTYVFDYTSWPKMMFVVDGSTLPNTIALPQINDVGKPQARAVNITYSGLTGDEPGHLTTITVKNWTVSGTMTVGSPVTLTGVLLDGCYYADHGMVDNPGEEIKVSITAMVIDKADAPDERINNIDDIVFTKKQVGYTDAESRRVTLSNLGTDDINGLTVTMSPVDVTADDGTVLNVNDIFTMTVSPPFRLGVGDSVVCEISRNLGLPVGEYRVKVEIGSNTKVLGSFYVSVQIVDDKVYPVIITVVPTGAGTAEAYDTSDVAVGSYIAGETVKLKAETILDSDGLSDYEFECWEITNGGIATSAVIANPTDSTTSFTMPDLETLILSTTDPKELHITARFKEGPCAPLRLDSLQLFNPDETENALLDYSTYAKTTFAPLTRKYAAIVPATADTNRVEFGFNLSVASGLTLSDVEFEIKMGGAVLVEGTDWKYNAAKLKYEITTPLLKSAPDDNLLTITIKRKDGMGERTYTVLIKRRVATDDLLEMNYGNSPFGLIMQHCATDTSESADVWKEEFRTGNCFDSSHMPTNGRTGVYQPEAWGKTVALAARDNTLTVGERDQNNYDRNDYALFVYQGGTISDPGIVSAQNSLGETVATGSVKSMVYGLVELTPKTNLKEMFREGSPISAIDLTSGAVTISETVRPGLCFITYEFEDYDGSKLSINRPLIVLYNNGDVNMDGTVDATDAGYIANRYNAQLPAGNDLNYRIYTYRICDANRDRNINVGDYRAISNRIMTEYYK